MKIVYTKQELSTERKKLAGKVALVMTMGALHQGHLSLVKTAKEVCDSVIVTIFVNPTQFGPTEDFDLYPRNLDEDISLLSKYNVDLLYAPSIQDMYPNKINFELTLPGLTDILEGESRPNHFSGVALVVLKILHRTYPDVAIFGQKDAQQFAIIKKMCKNFDILVELLLAPIVREYNKGHGVVFNDKDNGLALSSRNRYLSAEERDAALVLSKCLNEGEKIAQGGGDIHEIVIRVANILEEEPLVQIDYIAIVTVDHFKPILTYKNLSYSKNDRIGDKTKEASTDSVSIQGYSSTKLGFSLLSRKLLESGEADKEYSGKVDCYLLLAVKVGSTRLIDNNIIEIRV